MGEGDSGPRAVDVVEFHACENIVQPINESARKMRKCGKPAKRFVNGKWRCDLHAARANRSKT